MKIELNDKQRRLQRLAERDGPNCYLCDATLRDLRIELVKMSGYGPLADNYPTIDHLVPLAWKGRKEIVNERIACPACNNRKNDMMLWDYLAEYREYVPDYKIKELRELASHVRGNITKYSLSRRKKRDAPRPRPPKRCKPVEVPPYLPGYPSWVVQYQPKSVYDNEPDVI